MDALAEQSQTTPRAARAGWGRGEIILAAVAFAVLCQDPGYPFLAAPFQGLGIIRLAPLCYAALGCLGLFAGAWLLIRVAHRATLAAATSAVLVVALFGLGFWSFTVMRTHPFTTMGTAPTGHVCHGHCRQGPAPAARTR